MEDIALNYHIRFQSGRVGNSLPTLNLHPNHVGTKDVPTLLTVFAIHQPITGTTPSTQILNKNATRLEFLNIAQGRVV